jgi:mannose-6-phosphate isomerase-like protein (cupin superfamily)
MSDYTVLGREQATDFMAQYPGFGEMRSYTHGLDCEQVALTWRQMPPGTGGKGSYGHRHKTQEELYLVVRGKIQVKVGDDVFEAGPQTAVRIAPHALRSIHNDGPDEAEVVLVSVKLDDMAGEVETVPDFWPEG